MGGAEQRLMGAMLLTVGERTYAATAVQDVLDRAELPRSTFYKHFADKADCFGQAYERDARRLERRILGAAARERGWVDEYRAGLGALLRFAATEPLAARALLLEVDAARGRAADAHDRVVDRLVGAIDSARNPIGAHCPPPLTARFIAATAEITVREWLAGDKSASAISLLPNLVHIGVLFYFGEVAAQEAFERT